MEKALQGLKVIDLTHAYNGPFCTMLLADNGADVIKIEPLQGDQCRQWGPMDEKSGESGFFAFLNRNSTLQLLRSLCSYRSQFAQGLNEVR